MQELNHTTLNKAENLVFTICSIEFSGFTTLWHGFTWIYRLKKF